MEMTYKDLSELAVEVERAGDLSYAATLWFKAANIKIGQLRAVNFANTGTREQNARNKRRKSKMDERLITLLSIWGWASFALIVILLACKGR